MSGENDKRETPSVWALRVMGYLMLAGLLSIIVFNGTAPDTWSWLSASGVGILVAGASALVGGLLGFLFGVPRTLQSEPSSPAAGAEPNAQDARSDRDDVTYRANTNLEQISDWLTKILVGVGLTQLTVFPAKLHSLSSLVAKGLGGTENAIVLAGAILVSYGVCGFLFSYLWTRLYLATALREADLRALAKRIDNTHKEVGDLQQQTNRDAEALSLVNRHFDPRSDTPKVDEEQLRAAIIEASLSVRTTIFYDAWKVRKENWEHKKPIMERTIPIFRALVEGDKQGEFHMNHGQLGFALKDQRKPAWVEAEAELTEAITIRDEQNKGGWFFYEFNRAICRIMLESTTTDADAREALKSGILDDLRKAAQPPDLRKLIQKVPTISTWANQHRGDLEGLND